MKFWIDENRNHYISYKKFLSDINNLNHIRKFIISDNPYFMLIDLVAGMLYGREMILMDADFSDNEIEELGYDSKNLDVTYTIEKRLHFNTIQDIAQRIRTSDWKLWMFTSGTTDLPKKVCHTYVSLGRNVQVSVKHANDIWAFAYKLSHMAGIQVFLQAIMNVNPIIYVFESLPQDIVMQLKKYSCTNISATPTFYRNILTFIDTELTSLQHITLGGEQYDKSLCLKLCELLPSAKIHNIYASTETGTVLHSNGDTFYIPDKYKDKIKISEQGEVLIHKTLLGKFIFDGEWYNTHDLVIEDKGKIRFVSRKSDIVNIGGYKVNPLEVEAFIQQVDGVVDCVVKNKPNAVMGNILFAEIISDKATDKMILKKAIIQHLKVNLQPFKIPRIYNFVSEITRTYSGKKVRK